MQLAFIGFGLIGGSVSRAVRSNPAARRWKIAAWSPSGDGPRQALADGVIDRAAETPEAVLRGADLVVLAGLRPPASPISTGSPAHGGISWPPTP